MSPTQADILSKKWLQEAQNTDEYSQSDILGAHSGAAEDSCLLGCDTNSYWRFEGSFCFHLQDQAVTPTASRDLKIDVLEKVTLFRDIYRYGEMAG
jgi:hypothetical protein